MRTKPDIIVITEKDQADLALEMQVQEAGFLRIGFYPSREALLDKADYLDYPFILLEGFEEINFDICQLEQAISLDDNICALKFANNDGQDLIELDDRLNIISNKKRNSSVEDGYVAAGAYLIQSPEALEDEDLKVMSWKGLPMSFMDEYLPTSHYRSGLLLDRDGIINVDTKYLHKFEDVEIYEDVVPLIKYFNARNLPVCVVTNQSGVARGMYTETDVIELHKQMDKLLRDLGCEVNGWFFSPFHEDGKGKYKKKSLLRKPYGGMALQAAKDFPIRLSESFMIGDKVSDDLQVFGLKTIHIRRSENLEKATSPVVDSLTDALKHIEKILD